MAARVLAQVLVAGATVVFRAATQAWAQALVNAQKTGVAQEAASAAGQAVSKAGQMTVQEAQLILGVDASASWGELVRRYKHLFEQNQKYGSFYLQSKVYRAKERLEEEYEKAGLKTDEGSETTADASSTQQQHKQ